MEKYKHKMLIFIILTYLMSWLIWLPLYLNHDINTTFMVTLGTYMPSVIGIFLYIMLYKFKTKQIIKIQCKFNIKLKYYLISVLLPLSIVGIAYVLMIALNMDVPNLSYFWYELPIVFITILFLMGPLGEEFGWRGYLYPVFREKYSLILTSIWIGIFWTFWHLPLFFIEGVLQYEFVVLYGFGISFIGYLFYTILLSFIISVYFEKTKRSIITPLVLHTMANLSIGLIPLVFNRSGALIQLSVMSMIVVVLCIKHKSWITKKPL